METEEARQSITACEHLVRNTASDARTHATGDLAVHLRSLIDRPETSDLVFICKDEAKVRACRIFLIGRSPVFDKMLTNGMLETTSSTVNVPEISSGALLPILEFLYTGDIFQYGPKDWKMGLEIMSAAHFFLLSDVDRIVQGHLVAQIAGVATNFRQMAVMLTTAMTFMNLSHDEDVILLELVRLLDMKWTHTEVACCLSEAALDFILRHSKPNISEAKDRWASSLDEYFRFRGVVLWCACNSDFSFFEEEASQLVNGTTSPVEANKLVSGAESPAVQVNKCLEAEVMKLVNGAIPLVREELYSKGANELGTMEVTWFPKGIGAQDKIRQFFASHHASKEAAMRLLVHIDWVRMPAALFIKLVEPLKLIPDSKLVDVFRFHTLQRPMRVKLNWIHDGLFEIQDDGFVIRKIAERHGSAMCQLANRLSNEVCVWRLTCEEYKNDIQIGFLCGEGIEEASRVWNFKTSCSSALGASGVGKGFMTRVVHRTGAVARPSWPGTETVAFQRGQGGHLGPERSDVKSIKQVEFRYHRSKRSCDITVDGKDLGTMWEDLSGRSVFPVVSLGSYGSVHVRLDIVSGFEIL